MIQQGTPEDASVSQISNEAATKHNKDNNTSTIRQSQMAFATDIAQGLINEVRKLQQTIQEKDRLIVELEISVADNEKDRELTQKQLRQKNTIEDKLKEDNWNLEMANQELQSNLSDLSQTTTKLNADHSKALKQLRAALEQVEIFKAQQEKATSTLDAVKARHDHEQQVLRRNNGTLQRDMVQLKKRMDEVNTELKICKSKLAIRSTVSNNNIQQLLRGNNDDENNNRDDPDSDRHANTGTGGDTLAPETTTSNIAANTQRALEVETLKQSLGHAHRMISNLRNNLQKEKVEKIELKKVLADTQEAMDQLEKSAIQNEYGRGSLKKNTVANKTKVVVRKRGGVARKGHSVSNSTNETHSSEDQSNSMAIDTTIDIGNYGDDNSQLLAGRDDLDSGEDNTSMDDSNSLHQDSADEDDLHRLDLSPFQQGQSLDMELQLGGFNSSFKPLSSELEETFGNRFDLSPIHQGQSLDMELQLGGFNSSFKPLSSELEETFDNRLNLSPIHQGQSLGMELQLGGFNSSFKPLSSEREETLDERQYSDKGVNTCSDLASTLSFGQQTTSLIHGSTCVLNGNDTAGGNNNSGDDKIEDKSTNKVSMPSKPLPKTSLPDTIASSYSILDLKHSPIPCSSSFTEPIQRDEQHLALYNENAYNNATPSHDGVITPVPGSPPLNQQKSHSLDSINDTAAPIDKLKNDRSCISDKITSTIDRHDDGDHNSNSAAITSIPTINDSTTDNNHTGPGTSHIIDNPAAFIISKDISSDKHLIHTNDNFEKPSSTPPSNDDALSASETTDKIQPLYAPLVTQQCDPLTSEICEQQPTTTALSISKKEQLDSDSVDTLAVTEYSTRDIKNHADLTLGEAIVVDELEHTTMLDKMPCFNDQDDRIMDNKMIKNEVDVKNVDADDKPNHQVGAPLDLDRDEANDIDRTLMAVEITPTINSAFQLNSAMTTTYTTTYSDDGYNAVEEIYDNSDTLMMDTPDMMSRDEADALIKAGIADALAKERLEAATRRQELDDNFITRSEAEAMAKEQTEQAVKKERDRASAMLTKAQADSLARTYAEQTLQVDQQRRQSQEHTTSTYPVSSFLAKAQAAASNKAPGSSISQTASRRLSQTSVGPSPKTSTSSSSTATVSSSSSSSSRLGKLSHFMKIQPSVSTPAKSNRLRPSASMSSLRRTTTASSSIHHHQQAYRSNQQLSQQQHQQRHDDLLQPPSAPSYGSVRITETSMYAKQSSTGLPKQQHLKKPSMQSLSSARSGMAPSLFSMGDLTKQGANGDLISAITQTMIGEWMWKHTRKHVGGGISVNKHKRFFWVHPYTRTLYWSTHEPGADADEAKAKSAFIESISSIPSNDTMGASPLSLLIKTAKRDLKLTAPSLERHEIWRMSLSYLLVPPGEESTMDDVIQVDPYHGTTTSAGSVLSRTFSSTTDITTPSDADTTIPISQQNHINNRNHPSATNDDDSSNDMIHARQECDDHDVSTPTSP